MFDETDGDLREISFSGNSLTDPDFKETFSDKRESVSLTPWAFLASLKLNVFGDVVPGIFNPKSVNIHATNGFERWDLYDSAGDDRFVGKPALVRLSGNGFSNLANGGDWEIEL